MKQLHTIFFGQVQAVGLRYHTKEMADSLDLTGYVKNLPDGRVELLAEGEEDNLRKLLVDLQGGFEIQKTETTWSAGRQQFPSFTIKFD